MVVTIFLGSLLGAMALGMPIAFALMVCGIALMLHMNMFDAQLIAQNTIDGADNFATRYLVNDAAVLLGKPYVWGSIFRFEGQASVFWEDAPDGRGLNYRDLYPEPPAPGTVPSCAEGGVLGVLCASIGSIQVNEAIKRRAESASATP